MSEPLVIRGTPADCRPGWYPLIRKLDADLAVIDPQYVVGQIKEKYGTLRYYADPVKTDGGGEFHRLIDRAEEESGSICEVCGERGELRSRGDWVMTRCDRHASTIYRGVTMPAKSPAPVTPLAKADAEVTKEHRAEHPKYDEDAKKYGKAISDFNAGWLAADTKHRQKSKRK